MFSPSPVLSSDGVVISSSNQIKAAVAQDLNTKLTTDFINSNSLLMSSIWALS